MNQIELAGNGEGKLIKLWANDFWKMNEERISE